MILFYLPLVFQIFFRLKNNLYFIYRVKFLGTTWGAMDSVFIKDFEKVQGPSEYVTYKIVLRRGNTSWTVNRRYSDFYKFHSKLKKTKDLPALPPKSFFVNVGERAVLLDKYVQELLVLQSSSFWNDPDVVQFFDIPLHNPIRLERNKDVRNELLSGSSKGRRFGNSVELNDEQLVLKQKLIMEQQDSDLDKLSSVISRQKNIGIAISEELDTQNRMLGELERNVDSTATKLRATDKSLKKL